MSDKKVSSTARRKRADTRVLNRCFDDAPNERGRFFSSWEGAREANSFQAFQLPIHFTFGQPVTARHLFHGFAALHALGEQSFEFLL